ncbi:hypothetical protein ACOSQ3_007691 [Xanthoceras sorbifolium]
MIFNIQCILPPKSLLRFKCVCKSWQSFSNKYKYYNQKLILLLHSSIQSIDFEVDEAKVVDLRIPFKGTNLGIASCNGLLCISTKSKGFVGYTPSWRAFGVLSLTFSPTGSIKRISGTNCGSSRCPNTQFIPTTQATLGSTGPTIWQG